MTHRPDGLRAVLGTHPASRVAVIDRREKVRLIGSRVPLAIDDWREAHPFSRFLQEWHAQHARSIPQHEAHLFGCDRFGRTDEVAFVLSFLCIDDDDQTTGLQSVEGFFNGMERFRRNGSGHGSMESG